MTSDSKTAVPVASLADLAENAPITVRVSGVDLVLVGEAPQPPRPFFGQTLKATAAPHRW
ncbi:MAG: hypothetical protein P4L86_25070 [Mycobacterium sp.]|nr:hypothetical protein [Mycobacterium sp.]